MIRILLMICGASFVLAVVCLAGAFALGGHDFWRHNGWRMHGGRITINDGGIDIQGPGSAGQTVTREISWSGDDAFDIDAPADVQFTQAPGPGKLTITGPKATVDRLELSGGRLDLADDDWNAGRVTVVMTAPAVRRFSIGGDGSLAIASYDQDELDIDVSGHGDVNAKGRARAARIDISGDGEVDLGALTLDSADADISGSGRASIAPASAANLRISGSGEIDLLSHPANLTSDVSGSGRIVEGAAPAAQVPPTQPAAPAPPPKRG